MKDTIYLMKSKMNRKRLNHSINQLENCFHFNDFLRKEKSKIDFNLMVAKANRARGLELLNKLDNA